MAVHHLHKIFSLLISLILCHVISCGNSNNDPANNSNQVVHSTTQSLLNDGLPHPLKEIFEAIKSPVISLKEINLDNDGQKDLLVTTADNEIYSVVKQENAEYIVTPFDYNSQEIGKLGKAETFGTEILKREPILVSCETGDLNNDGIQDIILGYAGTDGEPLKSLIGSVDGQYVNMAVSMLPALDIPVPWILKLADVNQDGLLDILLATPGKIKIDPFGIKDIDPRKNYLLLNNGKSFSEVTLSLLGQEFAETPVIDIQVKDFDNDSLNEILLISPNGNVLYENSDQGYNASFYSGEVLPQPKPNNEILLDADGDGDLDTIVIKNGTPAIVYNNPDSLQKPAINPADSLSQINSSYVSPFQYKITAPGKKDIAGIRQIGDIVYFELDSILPAYVWGNIVVNFDPTKLRCVSIEEDPWNWHGFWVWWTLATGMAQYGGGGEYYHYDSTGKGSSRAKTWVDWYGQGIAGPVGTYDNSAGKIRLYTSTLAGYTYTAPLWIGFEVLQTGAVDFTVQSNNFTAYDFNNVDTGTKSTINISLLDQCVTNEDIAKNVRVKICGPTQVNPGDRYLINTWGQLIVPKNSQGWNIYAYEIYENGVLIDGSGFKWGEEHSKSFDFTKTQPGAYTYRFRMGDRTGAHNWDWVEAELTVTVGSPVTIYADEFVPVDTEGATAELYADVQPPSLLDGATYFWQVASGPGGVFTETYSQISEFIPNDIGVTTVEFVLQTAGGAEYTAGVDITAWDLSISVADVTALSKPKNAGNENTALFETNVGDTQYVVIAVDEEKKVSTEILGVKSQDVSKFEFSHDPPTSDVIEITVDSSTTPPTLKIKGKKAGSVTLTVKAKDPAVHVDEKAKSVTVQVLGTTVSDNGKGQGQTELTIIPNQKYINVGQTVTYEAWGVDKDGKAVKVAVNWTIKPASGIANFTGTSNKTTTVSVKGTKVGSVELQCNGESAGTPAKLPITVVLLDLDTDIDRDGNVTETDEPDEVSQGTIVIANKEEVYADPKEPARRREVLLKLETPKDSGITKAKVTRSSDKVKLFDTQKAGNELFGNSNVIELAPGQYWLEGGANASLGVRKDSLSAKMPDGSLEDIFTITVIWVNISGEVDPTKTTNIPPVYDGSQNVTNYIGHNKLGVQKNSVDASKIHGIIEIQGGISPSDIDKKNSWNTALTTNFVEGVAVPATADFGFIFRRIIDGTKLYANGVIDIPNVPPAGTVDDSLRTFQDPDPDLKGKDLLIIDVDGPSALVKPPQIGTFHNRTNFTEYAIFNFEKKKPERCSRKMKWCFSGDIAVDYNGDVVFIRDMPNNNDANMINEVVVDKHLASLKIGIPKATLTSAETAAGDKKIKKNANVEITITGADLCGIFVLVKDATIITSANFKVKSVNDFSDLKEVKVTFNTPGPVGKGYDLMLVNEAGESNAIEDFEITD